MKDHKVVATPLQGELQTRVNIAEFVLSQDLKQPPKLRRSLTPSRLTKNGSHHSKSPQRRRLPNSRDLVQEVYDRMGVNYVRGQTTADRNVLISTNSEISKLSQPTTSNVSRVPGLPNDSVTHSSSSFRTSDQTLSIVTGNVLNDEERDERKSVRSTRSVKSLMSAFGGGKSVTSGKGIESRNGCQGFEYSSSGEGVREKIIDCHHDSDMDATMSIISLDESQWTHRKQQQQEEEENTQAYKNGDIQSRQESFNQTSSSSTSKSSLGITKFPNHSAVRPLWKATNNLSATIVNSLPMKDQMDDKQIDDFIKEIVQSKFIEIKATFEEEFRRLEEHINRRLDEIEKKNSELSHTKGSSKATPQNPRGRQSSVYKDYRL